MKSNRKQVSLVLCITLAEAPIFVRVKMCIPASTCTREEGVCQDGTLAVERISISVVSLVKGNLYVALLIVVEECKFKV